MESCGEGVIMRYAIPCMHTYEAMYLYNGGYDLALCCVLAGYWDDTLMNFLLSRNTLACL